MKPKPPQLTPENAARFQEQGVADVYHLRLPHPEGVFTKLVSLLPEQARAMLDVGTGNGVLARRLIEYAERVDAVDVSAPLLAKARAAPGGDAANLNWILARVEDADLQPPYGLITGGDSIHWMDWDVVFPKFHKLLVPEGFVAIVGRSEQPMPWQDALTTIIEKVSVYRQFERYSLIDELGERGYFEKIGDYHTPPMENQQSVDDYIMSWFSRGGLARETMRPEHIDEFASQLRDLITPYAVDGYVTLLTVGRVTWGRPLP